MKCQVLARDAIYRLVRFFTEVKAQAFTRLETSGALSTALYFGNLAFNFTGAFTGSQTRFFGLRLVLVSGCPLVCQLHMPRMDERQLHRKVSILCKPYLQARAD